MSRGRLSASAVRRIVGIGQRWGRDERVIVIYQVHRGERKVEAHLEDEDPCVPGTRFLVSFADLGSKYRPLDNTHAKDAA